MAKFKEGQQVVCLHDDWMDTVTKKCDPYGPRKDQLVTVDFYSDLHPEYCCFVEYEALDSDGDKNFFHEENFAPVADITELQEILQSETVEA